MRAAAPLILKPEPSPGIEPVIGNSGFASVHELLLFPSLME